MEAKFYAWLWVIESMHSHHIGSVLFEMEFGDLWGGLSLNREHGQPLDMKE